MVWTFWRVLAVGILAALLGWIGLPGCGDAPGHHGPRCGEGRGLAVEGLSDAAIAAARLGDTAPGGRAVPLSDLARPGRG
jgi:anaerobic selenocysteine-containing dehydrogenase